MFSTHVMVIFMCCGAFLVESRAHLPLDVVGFVPNHIRHVGFSAKSKPQLGALLWASEGESRTEEQILSNRRSFLTSIASISLVSMPFQSVAEGSVVADVPIEVIPAGDVKKLFNEGRALEAQGNILAAQRLYTKITKVSPGFIYGWSSLGNTLTAQGELNTADEAYTKAISLCEENLRIVENSPGTRRCDDLYLLLLNRGSVRLNNNQAKEALVDLQRSNILRARPDAVILQNLARAQGENDLS